MKKLLVSKKYRFHYRQQTNKSTKHPLYEVKLIDVIQLTDGSIWAEARKHFTEEGFRIMWEKKELVEEYETTLNKPLF